MSNRIPPSLSWLVDKRKRIHSEILSLEKQIEDLFFKKDVQLRQLRDDLSALDHTIRLHEIRINPDKLKPIRDYNNKTGLAYGELTRLIYDCLGQSDYGLTTAQITDGVAAKAGIDLYIPGKYRDIRTCIRCRLKNLVKSKRLTTSLVNQKKHWSLLP